MFFFKDGVNIYWSISAFVLAFRKSEKQNEKKVRNRSFRHISMSKESRGGLVYSSTKGCSLKTRVGFLALENTELVCISFGVFLPKMGPPKPHTPHKSIISLPPHPPSPLDDRHLIFCHPGNCLLPQDQILPDTTHGYIQSCLV